MKNLFLLIGALYLSLASLAQVPKVFNLSATALDENDKVLSNQSVAFEISILENSEDGTEVYTENHTVTTNEQGVFTVRVGEGTATLGNFSDVNWNEISKFYKISMDVDGGTNFTEVGISEVVSVPYALTADRALNDKDTDEKNEIQELSVEENDQGDYVITLSLGNSIIIPVLSGNSTDEIQDIEQVLAEGNDAGGHVIKNAGNPTEIKTWPPRHMLTKKMFLTMMLTLEMNSI